jgi:hypothetical protein
VNLSAKVLAVSEAISQSVPIIDDAPATSIAVMRPSDSFPVKTCWVAELHAMSIKTGESILRLKYSFIVKGAANKSATTKDGAY